MMAAPLAQILAQTLTTWAILFHVAAGPGASLWFVIPLAAALVVPFRHAGTFRDRAKANFAAAVVASGILWWELLALGLSGLLGGSGPASGLLVALLLTATVLYTLAGGLFWLGRDEPVIRTGEA